MRKSIRIKPSKSQSIMGLITSSCFTLIGIFVVLPSNAGLFGYFWTFMAAAATIINAINLFTKQTINTTQIEIEDRKETNFSSSNVEDRLLEAENLYRKGLISQSELAEKRKEILKQL